MDKIDKVKSHLRKAAVLALAAAAVLLVRGAAVSRQEVPFADSIPPAVVYTIPESSDVNLLTEADESDSRRERQRTLLQKILRAAATLFSFVLPLILRGFTLLGKALITPLLSPAAAALAALAGDSIATFLLMISMLSLFFKLTYPDRKLREFYTLRNLLMMLTASAGITFVLRFNPKQLSDELIELVHIAGAGFIAILCAVKVLAPSKESAPAGGSERKGKISRKL